MSNVYEEISKIEESNSSQKKEQIKTPLKAQTQTPIKKVRLNINCFLFNNILRRLLLLNLP